MQDYKDWEEYKNNKLAAKQADRMFDCLMKMNKRKATPEEFQEYYKQLRESHLYKKHSALYCQILSDVAYLRQKL